MATLPLHLETATQRRAEMPYWMVHEEHGEMPVYDGGAKDAAEKLGWKLLNTGESPNRPPKASASDAPAPVDEEPATPAAAPPAKKKPGKK
jgi:hypothetical protein